MLPTAYHSLRISCLFNARGMLLLLILLSCHNKREETHPTVQNITESVYASGIIKSKNQYQVYSTVNGLIQQILIEEGELVTKGQPLIKLQNEIVQLQTESAQLSANYAEVS